MHIARMWIDNAPVFPEPVEFVFDEKVNLFIGPNSSGKSIILKMLGTPEAHWQELPLGSSFQNIGSQFHLMVSDDWPLKFSYPSHPDTPDWENIPWVRVGAVRIGAPLSKVDVSNESLDQLFSNEESLDLFDSEKVEAVLQLMVEEARSKSSDSLLGYRFRGESVGSRAGLSLKKAMDKSFLCTRRITSEVLTGSFPHNLVEGGTDFQDSLFVRYPQVRLGMAFDVSNGNSEPIHLLSSGTQSSLLWIRFLALKILYHYDWEEGWQNKPAILLIDEIENHLHPTWQRRVIPALLEHFPGLQIFATTHSPFVVAGLKAGQVHLLNRDAEGRVTASTNTEDIIGWTADEILRTMMGVDDPTDLITIERSDRLRQLRRKETLTADEESELNTLRRQVSESLISKGGPIEAQRERYSDLMQRFLLSRQSDLSQDGG